MICTQGFRVQLPAGPLAAKPLSSKHENVKVEEKTTSAALYNLLMTLLNFRAKVQMEARLLWEQEDLGSTPRCPT